MIATTPWSAVRRPAVESLLAEKRGPRRAGGLPGGCPPFSATGISVPASCPKDETLAEISPWTGCQILKEVPAITEENRFSMNASFYDARRIILT